MRQFFVMILLVALTGCASSSGKKFELKNLAKTDIDLFTDIHIDEIRRLEKELIVKLYKRNPIELTKIPDMTVDKRIGMLMDRLRPVDGFAELNHKDGVEALYLAFDPLYHGDRVFALMAGITGMINKAYDEKLEVFVYDELDEQKLYNSARNLEIVAWLLNNKRDEHNRLLLLSNGVSKEGVVNYSYERVLSQMIIIQDMMAKLIADSSNRQINTVVHGVASMVFIPI